MRIPVSSERQTDKRKKANQFALALLSRLADKFRGRILPKIKGHFNRGL